MIVHQRSAAASLRSVLQSFAEPRARFGADVITTPFRQGPINSSNSTLRTATGIHDDGHASAAPEIVVVGPQSYRRTRLILSGNVHVFTIRFQPGSFHALSGVPMTSLVNKGLSINDLIGGTAVGLRDAVMAARSFGERVAAAQSWFGDWFQTSLALHLLPYDAVAEGDVGCSVRGIARDDVDRDPVMTDGDTPERVFNRPLDS